MTEVKHDDNTPQNRERSPSQEFFSAMQSYENICEILATKWKGPFNIGMMKDALGFSKQQIQDSLSGLATYGFITTGKEKDTYLVLSDEDRIKSCEEGLANCATVIKSYAMMSNDIKQVMNLHHKKKLAKKTK